MAVVFSSSGVRSARPAKPPLLRTLVWTMGIQAALGGTLVMIHDRVFTESPRGNSGIVCVDFGDEAGEKVQPSFNRNSELGKVRVSPLILRQNDSSESLRMPHLATEDVEIPSEIPHVQEKAGEFFDNEDFGALIAARKKESRNSEMKNSKLCLKNNVVSSASQASSGSSEEDDEKKLVAAKYKSAPSPPYPRAARAEGREGVVMLKIVIDAEGCPSKVSIARSSGSSELDDAALNWVRDNWLFYPATTEKGTVESTMIAPLRFKLQS